MFEVFLLQGKDKIEVLNETGELRRLLESFSVSFPHPGFCPR